MFSEKDFERLWFLYKTGGDLKGVSINSFCISNNIPYTAFYDWFKKTQKKGSDYQGLKTNVLKEFLGDAKIKFPWADSKIIRHGRYLPPGKLTPDEIYRRRNSKKTTEIIEKLRTELYDALANPEESRSELMSKVLNYLKTFWNQIFAYRNDGEYSIDNMAAERAIRPITVQRKNSLFFGSVKGIQSSAIYNTFIETCKQAGVSFRDYFCKLLRELKKGRTDYENLLPMTICK